VSPPRRVGATASEDFGRDYGVLSRSGGPCAALFVVERATAASSTPSTSPDHMHEPELRPRCRRLRAPLTHRPTRLNAPAAGPARLVCVCCAGPGTYAPSALATPPISLKSASAFLLPSKTGSNRRPADLTLGIFMIPRSENAPAAPTTYETAAALRLQHVRCKLLDRPAVFPHRCPARSRRVPQASLGWRAAWRF